MSEPDVFNEISDDLRREKLHQFWKENGAWIIGGAIAAVLLTAVLAFWRQWEYKHNVASTGEMIRIINAADLSKMEAFGRTGSKNHAMITRFVAAGTHLDRNEKDKALAIYDEIAGTYGIDKIWRDLARVISISLRFEKDSPEKLGKELDGLTGDSNAWRYTAREMQALLAARQGQTQKAKDILTKITADPLAPTDARSRAFTLRELYAADSNTGDAKKTSSKT